MRRRRCRTTPSTPRPKSIAAAPVAAADSVAPLESHQAEHDEQRQRSTAARRTPGARRSEDENSSGRISASDPTLFRMLSGAPPLRFRARCGGRRRMRPPAAAGARRRPADRRRARVTGAIDLQPLPSARARSWCRTGGRRGLAIDETAGGRRGDVAAFRDADRHAGALRRPAARAAGRADRADPGAPAPATVGRRHRRAARGVDASAAAMPVGLQAATARCRAPAPRSNSSWCSASHAQSRSGTGGPRIDPLDFGRGAQLRDPADRRRPQ